MGLGNRDNDAVLDAIRRLPRLRCVWLKARHHSATQPKGLARFIDDLKGCGNTSNRALRGLYIDCPLTLSKHSYVFSRTREADEWREVHPEGYLVPSFYEADRRCDEWGSTGELVRDEYLSDLVSYEAC